MKQTKQSFEFDYESVKNKALAQLKSGKPLLGKEGALGPLFKSFLEAALEAELHNHLQENKKTPIVAMAMGASNCEPAKALWS